MKKEINILVLGATGKVGGETVRLLAAKPGIAAIAAVRTAEKAAAFEAEGIATRELDLDRPATLEPALAGVDRVLLLTGYTVDMLRQSKRFLDAAKRQGVRHVVHVGASGAATNEVAHWGWHQLVESYIEQQGFTWTHLRPEAFMQNITGPGYRWLNDDVITHFVGKATWSWVDAQDVAAVAAEALAHPERHQGKIIPLGYDAKSMDEVAAILGTETGREIGSQAEKPEVFYEAAVGGGGDPAYLRSVYTQFKLNTEDGIPGSEAVYDNFEAIVSRPPRNWTQFARENRELV